MRDFLLCGDEPSSGQPSTFVLLCRASLAQAGSDDLGAKGKLLEGDHSVEGSVVLLYGVSQLPEL